MRLKKNYTSREVTTMTGLTARQLQWWDTHGLLASAIAPRRTQAGGFTERRYSPVDLYELIVLADLRRRGFSVGRLRILVQTLKERFGIRLFQAIDDGPYSLFTDAREIYLRTESGLFYNLLRDPDQPLLALGSDKGLRHLRARIRPKRRGAAKRAAAQRV
jgi:DNA-binding transcriptional MerR regulator